jgi:hydrogenase maturation protease
MARALVIGLGNPLRGDDGLGWHVVQELRATLPESSAELIACHQLTPELAEPVARARCVIFVDAAIGDEAGLIKVRELDVHSTAATALSHRLDPEALIHYAQHLYGSLPEAFMVSVNGEAYGYSETLSDAARSSLPAVLRLVGGLVPLAGCSAPRG